MSSTNFPKEVILGYAGEENARTIEFDCSEEFALWPNSAVTLMYSRPGEEEDVYAAAVRTVRVEEGSTIVKWTPDAFATELEGSGGYVQIFFLIPGEEHSILGKSAIARMSVRKSLVVDTEANVETYEAWLTRIMTISELAEQKLVEATQAVQSMGGFSFYIDSTDGHLKARTWDSNDEEEEDYVNVDSFGVDDALSDSSTNPVQNQVITAALGNKADASSVGTLSNLTTTAQGSVVAAINEVDGDVSELKSTITFDTDSSDISSQKSAKVNLYPSISDSAVKTFPSESPVYSTYVPVKSGYKYEVTKSAQSSRFAIATTATTPAYNVALIDSVRDDSASVLTLEATGNSKYLLIWFYYTSGDSSRDADTILASISIKETTGAKDRVARSEIASTNSRIDSFIDVSDVTSLLSEKSPIYPQSSSMKVKVFSDTSQGCSVYLPCKAGYTYTVNKTVAATRFALATTHDLPEYNVDLIDIIQDNSANSLTLTPTGTSAYMIIWFYYTGGTYTADQILSSISVEQNTHGVKDTIAREEIEKLWNYIKELDVAEFNTANFDTMNSDNLIILT